MAEYNPQGPLLRRYVHGDSDDDPLFWYEGFDLTHARFPHADRKGSIVAIAGVGGGLLSINTYDEYGIPGGANQGRFQYTGQAWLAELSMYYYKARIYSPRLGRFLQTDPIGYDDQINLYAYVGNNPINASDPEGKRLKGSRDAAERRRMVGFINARAQGRYKFEGRQLKRVGDTAGEGRSSYYADRLDDAIAARGTIKLDISDTIKVRGVERDVDREFGGGVTLKRNERESTVTVSGRSNMDAPAAGGGKLFSDAADIVAHELLTHAIPDLTGVDLGTPLANENRYRDETGQSRRAPDARHPQ